MNCIMPFTKDIKFENNLKEITSISLEHEETLNENNLLGNFLISGEYKTHELSVNTESFSYIIPFEVALTENIKKETFSFDIDDFTYEINDNNTLTVNINYHIEAENEEREEPLFEQIPNDFTFDLESEIKDIPDKTESTKEVKEEEKDNRDIPVESEETIINIAKNEEDTFVTYHIHIVKENENIDTICKLYNTNPIFLGEYNNLNDIKVNDKIIIPEDE